MFLETVKETVKIYSPESQVGKYSQVAELVDSFINYLKTLNINSVST